MGILAGNAGALARRRRVFAFGGLSLSVAITCPSTFSGPSAALATSFVMARHSERRWTMPYDARSRGYVPHVDRCDVAQFITFRLGDSVPAKIIADWRAELALSKQFKPDAARLTALRRRIERFEDAGHGECHLARAEIADLVQSTLLLWHGQRYELFAWCIMPNHVHVLCCCNADDDLGSIVHCWKSFTAHRANRILQRQGRFWMPEYHTAGCATPNTLTAP